jgi:magnesium chelatase family protein
MIQKYWGKISGPLLDRIDLQIEVPRLKKEEFSLGGEGVPPLAVESSEQIKQRILAAREIQEKRYGKKGILNGQLKGREIKKFVKLEIEAEKILEQALSKFFLSYRSIEKILKVSRTIADLEATEKILTAHPAEALNYRLFKSYF